MQKSKYRVSKKKKKNFAIFRREKRKFLKHDVTFFRLDYRISEIPNQHDTSVAAFGKRNAKFESEFSDSLFLSDRLL